jgi:hypothetical protein
MGLFGKFFGKDAKQTTAAADASIRLHVARTCRYRAVALGPTSEIPLTEF